MHRTIPLHRQRILFKLFIMCRFFYLIEWLICPVCCTEGSVSFWRLLIVQFLRSSAFWSIAHRSSHQGWVFVWVNVFSTAVPRGHQPQPPAGWPAIFSGKVILVPSQQASYRMPVVLAFGQWLVGFSVAIGLQWTCALPTSSRSMTATAASLSGLRVGMSFFGSSKVRLQ